MTLYDIRNDYLEALNNLEVNEDGEITNLDVIDEIKGRFEEKAEAVACYIKSLEANAKAVKEEIDVLKKRMESYAERADKLKEYLAMNMYLTETDRVETPKCLLYFRKSNRVVVDDEAEVDEKYVVTKTTKSISKQAIKDDLLSGLAVSGAHLEQVHNLQVK